MRTLFIAVFIMVSTSGLTQTFDNPLNKPGEPMEWYKGIKDESAKCIYGSPTEIDKLFTQIVVAAELDIDNPSFVHGNSKTYKSRSKGFEYRVMYLVTDNESSIVVNRTPVLYYEN